MVVWRSGSALASINEVNLRRARLVLGWVTVSGFNSRCGTFISVCSQLPRSTQLSYPFVGRHNEYQPKGGDALRLESKGRQVWFVCGRHVNLCDPIVTHGRSERFRDKELIIKRCINLSVYFTFTWQLLLLLKDCVDRQRKFSPVVFPVCVTQWPRNYRMIMTLKHVTQNEKNEIVSKFLVDTIILNK